MRQNGGLHNQLGPKRKGSPKLNKALLLINVVLFFCALIIALLYLYYKEIRSSIPMFILTGLTAINAWKAWLGLKGRS